LDKPRINGTDNALIGLFDVECKECGEFDGIKAEFKKREKCGKNDGEIVVGGVFKN